MTRALRMICVLALVLTPVLAHGADSGSGKTSTPAKSVAKPAAKSSKSSTKSKAKPASAQKAKSSATAASTSARSAGPRRLEDIHIEGEVPVPQVLFITARDQRRFLESHHDLYLRTSRELGEATPLPARVVLTQGGKPATTPATAPATTPATTEDGR